jgi:hypothetical protein
MKRGPGLVEEAPILLRILLAAQLIFRFVYQSLSFFFLGELLYHLG